MEEIFHFLTREKKTDKVIFCSKKMNAGVCSLCKEYRDTSEWICEKCGLIMNLCFLEMKDVASSPSNEILRIPCDRKGYYIGCIYEEPLCVKCFKLKQIK